MMRLWIVVLVTTALTAASAQAHNTPYGFRAKDVLVRQGRLLNALNDIFAPTTVLVECRGRDRVTLRDSSRGFRHVVCDTSIGTTYMSHLDARGRVFVTRHR